MGGQGSWFLIVFISLLDALNRTIGRISGARSLTFAFLSSDR